MQSSRPVIRIYARTQHGVIGKRDTNDLPFKSSEDLKAFKRYTLGNIVVMGNATAKSLNYKPLPGRVNVILSKTLEARDVPGFEIIREPKDIVLLNEINLNEFDNIRNTEIPCIFVIGGAKTFRAFDEYTEAEVVTIIDTPYKPDDSNIYYESRIDPSRMKDKALPLDKEGDDKIVEHYIKLRGRVWCKNSTFDMLDKIYPDTTNEYPYKGLLKSILECGDEKEDRTGTGTVSIFGQTLTYHDVSTNPPFTSLRKLPMKSLIGELLWFIKGCTNTKVLKEELKCNFWDEWASEENQIGPMYGAQWRGITDGVDQLKNLLTGMIEDPFSRRLLVDSWVPFKLPISGVAPNKQPDLGRMALAPCHFAFQVNVTKDYEVDLMWNQRSADVALGLPVNIASYYILLCLLCKAASEKTGKVYKPRHLTVALGDAHIYKNHLEETREMLDRRPLGQGEFTPPDNCSRLFESDITIEELKQYQEEIYKGITGYNAHPNFKLARNV